MTSEVDGGGTARQAASGRLIASQSAYLCKSADYNQQTLYRAEYWLQCLETTVAMMEYLRVCTKSVP